MIKFLNQYVPKRLFVLLASENVLILVTWAAVSFQLGTLDSARPILIFKALMATAVCQMCLYYADMYDLRSMGSRTEVFFRLLQSLGAATLLLALLFAVFPDFGLDVRVVEISIPAMMLILLVWRLGVDEISRTYSRRQRILLVGSALTARRLARELGLRPELPIELLGTVFENEESMNSVDGLRSLGALARLESIVEETAPDRLIIALEERRQVLPIKTLLKLRMQGLPIEEASALYEKITGRVPVESIHPSSLIFAAGFSQSLFRQVYSRIISVLAGTVVLILCGPLMLLVSIAIKLDSRGPVLYGQTRVGKDGRQFEILKFRSMRADAESLSGPVWAQKRDSRISRVGRVIRKLRIDELPQVLNVLAGHMGFVGPRPERPHFVAQLADQTPYYELRHSVRPGITGWAQVSCDYGATIEESRLKLEYDLFYLKNASLWFDLMILFKTIKIVLLGRGSR